MDEIGFAAAEAERAFGKAVRAGRRASLARARGALTISAVVT
jgi:hypothetical protein